MIDLTSALYLGLEYPAHALAPWAALTSGRPAVLAARPHALQTQLARLLGMQHATLAPSTLHVVTDLYRALPARTIHVDACSYAVTRWALAHAAVRGVSIHVFRSLAELDARLGPRAAIVTDAMCLTCRRISPLRALQRRAAQANGWLIVDDSQGIGVLGERRSEDTIYGTGGGGTLLWSRVPAKRVIVLGSLAKAFGAPLAFLAGSTDTVEWFERTSETRVHASPCNAAVLAALDAALRVNRANGDDLRARLLARVDRFRTASRAALDAGRFPVQATRPLSRQNLRVLAARLRRRGVVAIPGRRRLGFAITANHDTSALDRAGQIIGDELRQFCSSPD